MKKRILSLWLVFVLCLSLMPTVAFAAGYNEGDIAGTTGTGTESDPVVCDTFAEFKAAMENTTFEYVMLSGFTGYQMIPAVENLSAAVSNTTVKHLQIKGSNIFSAPLNGNIDCLIWSRANLTISGTGLLQFENGNTGMTGAVIRTSNMNLVINGSVTLSGTANGNTHGRALYLESGSTTINGGIFKGYSALATGSDCDAVYLDDGASLVVNDGIFSSSKHSSVPADKQTWGLNVSSSPNAVALAGGTYYGICSESLTLSSLLSNGYVYRLVGDSAIVFDGSESKKFEPPLFVDPIKAITEADCTIDTPTAGNQPDFSLISSDSNKYTVSVEQWYLNESPYPELKTTDTFEAGKKYALRVRFTAESGYTFDENTKFKINGLETQPFGVTGFRQVVFTVPDTPPVFEFTTQPQSGTAKKSEGYSFSWTISDTPDYYNLQVLWDGSWGGTGDTFLNGSTGTVPYVEAICTGNTSKYRIHAQKGAQSIYSDEFTVTWTDDTTPPVFEFTTQPQSGTAKKSEGYSFSWAISDTPDHYNLLVWWDDAWGGTGDTYLNGSTGTVPYVEAICTGNTSKYRIEAQKDGKFIYSDEFTVTWTDDTTPPAPLTELSATITAPGAGYTPVYTAATGSSDYTAEVISWYPVRSDGTNGSALMSTDVFEAGKKYAALVRFNANAGVTLDPNAAAVINGQNAVAAGFGIERDWVQFFAYFTVPEAQPTTYTVTFNMNGHGTAPATQTVNEGSKATKPANDPTAEGWTFGGWYADATFSVAFDFDSAITANTTVYAKWTPVHTHNYISVVTNPTCTEKGYTTHTCACGDSYVDTYITATGHTYGEWTITKEPTETETGLKERTGTVCKQTKTETVPKLVKTYTPGDVDGDGKISAADARLVLRQSVGLEKYAEGSDKFLACDVDFDGKVSAADARLILRASVGLENPKTWKKA